MNFLDLLERQSKLPLAVAGFLLIGVIGVIDLLTGNEIGFSVFYVLPISLITWLAGRRLGLAASATSAVVWLSADLVTRDVYSHALIPFWNTLIRLTFFIIITLLLSALTRALRRENELARVDHLTGAANSRFFHFLAQREIDRCQRYRHPFTLAYIDLDNFKAVNDRFGHSVGDRVLSAVVASIKNQVRKTDLVARLGGDEFVVLLPETGEDAARLAISKIADQLGKEMRENDWPVSFSIGALTCIAAPPSTDALVKMADELMYAVKGDNKNATRYASYAGAEAGT